MRKYLIIALTLLTTVFGGGIAFALDLPANEGMIKRIQGARQSTPTRVYKLVRSSMRTATSGTISIGSAVVYDTVSDDGITVRMTTTSADPAFAGIVVTLISPDPTANGATAADEEGKTNWGYIQVHGPTTATVNAGGTNGQAAGATFITSRDSGAITALELPTVLPLVADFAQYGRVANAKGGFFEDAADGSSTSVDVFIMAE